MAELAEYFAQIHNGDIQGIVQANPPHELTENQIALTKEEFFLLKSVHGANGNVVELANQMIGNISKKIGELEKSK